MSSFQRGPVTDLSDSTDSDIPLSDLIFGSNLEFAPETFASC